MPDAGSTQNLHEFCARRLSSAKVISALHLSLPNSSASMDSAYHKRVTDAPCRSMAHLGYSTLAADPGIAM
jgi:hypothetical protein